MLIAVCGDVHLSQYSSIVRKRGDVYSVRLENIIRSLNWFEQLSKDLHCDYNVYLGDFFDKPECNAEELSALSCVKWNDEVLDHYFLCGNHEMGSSDHTYSSAKVFDMVPGARVIDMSDHIQINNTDICFVPYILEAKRKDLSYYLPEPNERKRIIFSHNDLRGVQMGAFLSQAGFSLDEIDQNCDLFINGHLHNGTKVTDHVINLGNLTGQNFSENAEIYKHNVMILDTDTLEYKLIENPYALNFYKIDDFNKQFIKVGNNAVLSIKCYADEVEDIKKTIANSDRVVDYHLVVGTKLEKKDTDVNIGEILSIDHLETFKKYILATYENTPELMDELEAVIK